MSKLHRNQLGLTLTELLIVMMMMSFFMGIIMYFGFSYWRYASLLENDLDTFVSRLNAQDFVREAIGSSSGLIIQNSIPDANANNPDPVAGPNYWLPIHAVPGNTPAGSSGTTPLLYFKKAAITTSKTVAMNGTLPYEDEFIMYLNGSTKQLLVRSLANPSVANNKLVTSCPPASASASCPADKVILDKLDSVDSVYYSRSGNTVDYHSALDPDTGAYIGPDFPLVEALQFTFHIKDKPLFQKSNATINDTIVRIALRNI